MTERNPNMQDTFLNGARKQHTPVTVFLVNGVKLQGVISSFDNFSVILRRGSHMQLVYKHAIATVVPTVPFQVGANEESEQAEPISAYEESFELEDA